MSYTDWAFFLVIAFNGSCLYWGLTNIAKAIQGKYWRG